SLIATTIGAWIVSRREPIRRARIRERIIAVLCRWSTVLAVPGQLLLWAMASASFLQSKIWLPGTVYWRPLFEIILTVWAVQIFSIFGCITYAAVRAKAPT